MGGTPPAHRSPAAITPAASLRQLIDSLNREQRRNQELLASLGFALRSFTNLSRFLELVPLLTARLVEAEGAVLLTFRSDGGLWREQLHCSSQSRCGELLRQLAGLQDSDLDRDAGDEAMATRLDQLVRRQLGDVQLFGTSVVAKNRQRGRLYVFSGDPQFSWSEVRRRHVQLVADQTAVAIENELLLEEMRRHERLDQQLSIGGEIQSQLLPSRCPVIEGVELAARCRPAFQVGGDYFDFIPTRPQLLGKRREQGRWALVMGDVMGKGIPAGLLMTLLRGMLRAEVLTGLPPDRILHDLNELAQEDLAQSNRFVTLFYSELDPVTRVLRFSNAAHNPPLIWRRQRHSVERLDAPGLLIGLQPDADYGCEQVQLEPGDVLLYYTDGVTEASGVGGERFDEERLMRALLAICKTVPDAQGILDQLFARLDRFVGPGRQLEDDASMVVLKVRDEVVLPTL
ncbi:phosphoserine phosphatase RsbU/P [Synechococcus sp. Minos11]|jgi:sigma-B regulation protein RsbU (phosphoserine phosphatase)|uniref:PP2C family protein-serine/threonine phosphatase n=1 Tax=Synechococcus sp. Minos11 TaxID=221341 RepID=UPI00015252D9|nr:PP2C family protein-serine/threonine phosphatase [Synechococcus sp. Minos11]MEC8608351.1 PP2C family protein-serine/threonine phosphatase [Cyanobacteriota bacterium]OUW40182.1 MAG: serine/threonine protein phosphatase [Synechococcus sp. TMED185]RCL62749.1 MAG: serine/threonine protein phosphatase [Synechococcus sp. MED-G67]CAK26915.1 Serine phosphatase RsbU, regulator of sigma subunit [Synechococcus sp. RCC307]HCA61285.1 serine/threonine protein phosphatase [Synechococcales bacterium UBA864|tara:strand:+ start:787 stop:2160 length:1374 start_codon:yes stop_codon:yes gene_type:complete